MRTNTIFIVVGTFSCRCTKTDPYLRSDRKSTRSRGKYDAVYKYNLGPPTSQPGSSIYINTNSEAGIFCGDTAVDNYMRFPLAFLGLSTQFPLQSKLSSSDSPGTMSQDEGFAFKEGPDIFSPKDLVSSGVVCGPILDLKTLR